jgi:hypothetical protein
MEFRAWNTTLLSVNAYGQKTLVLPGGYLVWNITWSTSEKTSSVTEAIRGYLGTEELLSR